MKKTRIAAHLGAAALLTWAATAQAAKVAGAPAPLGATSIPQFAQPLDLLGPTGIPWAAAGLPGFPTNYDISICEFQTNILPPGTPVVGAVAGVAPSTWVWGYQLGTACNAAPGHSYLGPVMLNKRGVPTQMTFINQLPSADKSNIKAYNWSTDQTLIWGDPLNLNTAPPPTFVAGNPELNLCYQAIQAAPGLPPPAPCLNNYGFLALQPAAAGSSYAAPVPAAVHIHGGEVPAMLDGGPDAWWTNTGIFGHGYYTRNVTSLPALLAALPALIPTTVAGLPTVPTTVAALPLLPDPVYPVGKMVYDTATTAYYQNVLDVWTPTAWTYPVGTVVYDSVTAAYYQNLANVWSTPAAGAVAYPLGTVIQVANVVYKNIANSWTVPVPAITPYSEGTLVQNKADGLYYQVTGGAWVKPAGLNRASYVYPNGQEAAPVWFHDHILGATRLNVYAGIAGGYMITDDQLTNTGTLAPGLLPLGLDRNGNSALDFTTFPTLSDEVLVPLIIQDRMFDTTGQLFFPAVGINPEHPYWVPEFVGDTILVNGKVWPFLTVKPQRYRFLVLNGSNARAYELFFETAKGTGGPSIWVIGNDQGYLDAPQQINPLAKVNNKLVVMPGERYEIVVDFGLFPNQNLILRNTARTPYPGGAPVSNGTTGKVMQFRVGAALATPDTSYNPAAVGARVRPAGSNMLRLTAAGAVKTRRLTLNEVIAKGGPLEILVNNTKYDGKSTRAAFGRNDFSPVTTMWDTTLYSELPNEGETELWEIVNLTADAHPMHPHLVAFQVLNRQALDLKGYSAAYALSFPTGVYMPGFGPPLDYNCGNPLNATARGVLGVTTPGTTPCVLGGNPDPLATLSLIGAAIPPAPQEIGWKDTVMVPPNMVTRFLVRFARTTDPLATATGYDFSPDGGHGYVWHCHIIDHEDNEMMRPYSVTPNAAAARHFVQGVDF